MSLQIEQIHRERVGIERLQRQWEVDRLQESGRLLEAKVAERTSALAGRNEELMRSQADLADARDQALEASPAKSVLLANLSHELRTPLNAIIGYSEMLLEDVNDLACAQLTSDLDRISTAGHHLLDLFNDILDLSMVEAGRMDLYLKAFDVAALIDSVVSTVQRLVEKSDSKLEVGNPSDMGSRVADLTKVRQVLFNLLSNTSKFTEQGVITLTADHALPPSTMSASRSPEEWVRFQAKDTGIGVKPEQLEQMFDAFSLGDASTTRQYGGTGLGLAISSRYCHMMGGDITVESEPGRGGLFTVTDPAAKMGAPR
jgi:signal transduction histidine kinase